MHVPTLLRSWLGQSLEFVHATRLAALFDMVEACVTGAGLSITAVGRRLVGPTTLKHKIKRADRLIGNPHLYRERTAIYDALCRVTLARIAEPLILVDWSDLALIIVPAGPGRSAVRTGDRADRAVAGFIAKAGARTARYHRAILLARRLATVPLSWEE